MVGRKMAENRQSEGRQRLIPWLIAKINSQDIPGLYWLDNEKTTFRIPWKHGGKQDWSPEHSRIFKEWAVHTGKFREGLDTPEWAKWKTRLRCAFNKAPDIVELTDRSDVDATNPFKVYKLTPKSRPLEKPPKKREQETYEDQTPREPVLPEMLDEYNRSKSGELMKLASLPNSLKDIPSNDLLQGMTDDIQIISSGSISFSAQNIKIEEDMDTKEEAIVDPNVYPTNPKDGAPALINQASPAHGQPFPLTYSPHHSPASSDCTMELALSPGSDQSASTMRATTPGSNCLMYPQNSPSPLQGDLPMEGASLVDLGITVSGTSLELSEADAKLFLPDDVKVLPSSFSLPSGKITLQVIGGPDDLEPQVLVDRQIESQMPVQGHELHLKVQYLQADVMEEYILNEHGCRLKYGSDSDITSSEAPTNIPKILGPQEAQQLHLPPPDGIIKDERQKEFTERLLDCTNRGFHIECKDGDVFITRYCRTVVYVCNDFAKQGIKLQRRQRTKVFDLEAYQRNLTQHISNGSPEPCSATYISVGQPCSMENKASLISCTVKSALAYQLAEKALSFRQQPIQFSMDDQENSVEMPLDIERTYVGTL